MFSKTLSLEKILVIWNVRPTPKAKTLLGRSPVISRPSKVTTPLSGFTYPVITLKRVVLPEPLGPISPEMDPCSTSREQPERAWRPPKALDTPSARRSVVTRVGPHRRLDQ